MADGCGTRSKLPGQPGSDVAGHVATGFGWSLEPTALSTVGSTMIQIGVTAGRCPAGEPGQPAPDATEG
jgi:hypothetical protein